jgi:hypothetical protein
MSMKQAPRYLQRPTSTAASCKSADFEVGKKICMIESVPCRRMRSLIPEKVHIENQLYFF